MIYLDYAATTPMSDKAMEVYVNVAKHYFGNASSLHETGSSAKQIKEASAKAIAGALNAHPKDIHFTSGASESNFLAIYALLEGSKKEGKHIIATAIEHSSVKNVFERLEGEGYEVSWLGVNQEGRVELSELNQLVREDTVLVSVQQVNSEIGTIQPISEIGNYLQEKEILFHTDVVQAFGKIAIDVNALNVDALCISSHKIYGPKGMGAVWLKPGSDWKPFFDDITQNKKLKTGTDNVPGMAAFATAAKQTQDMRQAEFDRISYLRSRFIEQLKELDHECVVEGSEDHQSPFILGVRFPGMEGQFMMLECDQAGLAISTGSACQVGSEKPNRTMKALGYEDEQAREFVRFSFGKDVKEDDLGEIIHKIDTILTRHFKKVRRT
jgi:cysteine desulfurase